MRHRLVAAQRTTTSQLMNASLPDLSLRFTHEVRALTRLVVSHRNARSTGTGGSYAEFEALVQTAMRSLERAVYADALELDDVSTEGVVVAGERYRNIGKSPQEVLTPAGTVTVTRTVYRQRGGHGGQTVAPLDGRAGLVDGWVTPGAAELIARFVGVVTPAEAAVLLAATGTVKTSSSTIDRITKVVGEAWEGDRAALEEGGRVAELPSLPAPSAIAAIVMSIDGVMVRMKDAPNTPGAAKDEAGPHGHKEAASATFSLYDKAGSRLHTIALARMPETKKQTLHEQMLDELSALVDRYPTAQLVGLADGAAENWRILNALAKAFNRKMPSIVDYFHAAEHLSNALKAVGIDATSIEVWRQTLKSERDGADRVLAELMRLRSLKTISRSASKSQALDKEITYFTNNGKYMAYVDCQTNNFPIGSGVQEAACKVVVCQRMKRSGMSWRTPGGQAVLTLRCLYLSGRFDAAWTALEAKFRWECDVDEDLTRQRPRALAA